MPFQHSDLLVMELHLVEVISWHADVKHRDNQILSRARKQVLVDVVECATVEGLAGGLPGENATLCTILS